MAASYLRALGRLKEAQGPFEHQVALSSEIGDHNFSSADSKNLSELLLVRGELQAALERINDAVQFIDKTNEKYFQASFRATHAHVLAMQGELQDAKTLFEEADRRQAQHDPGFPYVFPPGGFHYVAFLIRTEPPSALPSLAERVRTTLQRWINQNHLPAIALDRLNLARIAARLGDKNAAAKFDDAILALKKAGMRDFEPNGYIARTGFRRTQDDFEGAWEDLGQVRHIAELSGMRLYLCDALIEEAWLHHLAGGAQMSRTKFEKAEEEVDAMGYHWQDSALDELRKALA